MHIQSEENNQARVTRKTRYIGISGEIKTNMLYLASFSIKRTYEYMWYEHD